MTFAVTDIDDLAAELIRRRARWLSSLSADEREGLDAVSLREVDARFEAWLDARRGVGDDGGG
jgi:hypothetical protein